MQVRLTGLTGFSARIAGMRRIHSSRRQFRTAIVAIGAVAFALSLAGSASALNITVDGTTATGMADLSVTSEGVTQLFDVAFVNSTFNQLQPAGGAPIYDLLLPNDPELWAENVASAIATALQDYNVGTDPDLVTVGENSNVKSTLALTPYADGSLGTLIVAEQTVWTDGWGTLPNAEFSQGNFFIYSSLTIVPEPGTAALLGLGLMSFGIVGRSRRQESGRA
jgi:hypothetical protein